MQFTRDNVVRAVYLHIIEDVLNNICPRTYSILSNICTPQQNVARVPTL